MLLESGDLEARLIAVAKGIKHCGDYGLLFFHPSTKSVHWTAADSDGGGGDDGENLTDLDEIERMLKLPGVTHVEIGDEWSPDEEGWKRLKL
mgnify:FL=1